MKENLFALISFTLSAILISIGMTVIGNFVAPDTVNLAASYEAASPKVSPESIKADTKEGKTLIAQATDPVVNTEPSVKTPDDTNAETAAPDIESETPVATEPATEETEEDALEETLTPEPEVISDNPAEESSEQNAETVTPPEEPEKAEVPPEAIPAEEESPEAKIEIPAAPVEEKKAEALPVKEKAKPEIPDAPVVEEKKAEVLPVKEEAKPEIPVTPVVEEKKAEVLPVKEEAKPEIPAAPVVEEKKAEAPTAPEVQSPVEQKDVTESVAKTAEEIKNLTDSLKNGEKADLGDGRIAYKVKRGDTFSQICQKVIGTSSKWKEEAKKIRVDYRKINPGMILIFKKDVQD